MKKKVFGKDVIVLLISTLITIASWVGFEVYRAYIRVETPENVQSVLQEINPVIDKEFFVKLKTETGYEE